MCIYKGNNEVKMVKENIKSNTQIFDEMFYCSAEKLQRQIAEEIKDMIK